uniref:Syntrophin, beta 2 n=2 Tax=Cyprinodon variegatus TaxID=28743 RepID=A0A3Q2GG34_CYPVA
MTSSPQSVVSGFTQSRRSHRPTQPLTQKCFCPVFPIIIMLTCIGGRQGGIAVRPPRGREAAVPNLENESFTSEQKPPFYCTNSQWVQLTSVLVFLLMKYIREVSPLFKKPSLVADLPWDGVRPQSPSYSGSEDSGSPKHSSSSSTSKDRKVISLKMCFISRNLTMPDLENRLLELHSPDGQHTVVLRCKDGASANAWFTAIHTNIAALLPQTLAHINAYLGASSTASTHPHLKHIAWLAEQIQLEGGRQQFRPVVMALTEKDILLFESVPWSRESWSMPLLTHPLLATRLVHSGSARGSPSHGSDLVFATRTGTGRGIESHIFRVETHWDLSTWTRGLVQGVHAAAEIIKEVSIGCTLNRQDVRLTLHYEKGFTVTREPADQTGGTVLFRYPYEKLKMSADDGIRNLYLDFGGPEGEMVFDLHSGPKPVVFVLHSFLSAKLTRMGLLT